MYKIIVSFCIILHFYEDGKFLFTILDISCQSAIIRIVYTWRKAKEKTKLKIQYRDAKDGGIEVLRCFSKEDQVEIPSEIEGKRVTKIGDYAFSAHKRKEDEAKEIKIGEDF